MPGRPVDKRVANIRTAGLRSRPYAGPLQAFLADASQRVRQVFHGPPYPDLPWEPKQAFGAVAGFYAAH